MPAETVSAGEHGLDPYSLAALAQWLDIVAREGDRPDMVEALGILGDLPRPHKRSLWGWLAIHRPDLAAALVAARGGRDNG